jgi:hypothetical protein
MGAGVFAHDLLKAVQGIGRRMPVSKNCDHISPLCKGQTASKPQISQVVWHVTLRDLAKA